MQAEMALYVTIKQHIMVGSARPARCSDGQPVHQFWPPQEAMIFRYGREGHHMQADVAMHERMEQRMMAKVRAAERALLDGEFNILASSPLGRAQVERFAALNARIQELEGLLGPGAKVIGLLSVPWVPARPRFQACL